MPLFGKKNKNYEKEKLRLEEEKASASYPRNQPVSYPTQPPSCEFATQEQPAARLIAQASFDSGARFTSTTPPSIPPPPPGYNPTPAQLAAMTGQQVQMVKAKTGFIKEPTSNGGYTFW